MTHVSSSHEATRRLNKKSNCYGWGYYTASRNNRLLKNGFIRVRISPSISLALSHPLFMLYIYVCNGCVIKIDEFPWYYLHALSRSFSFANFYLLPSRLDRISIYRCIDGYCKRPETLFWSCASVIFVQLQSINSLITTRTKQLVVNFWMWTRKPITYIWRKDRH